MLKKILTVVVAAAITLTFASCGDKKEDKAPSDANLGGLFGEVATQTPVEKPKAQVSIEKMYNPAPENAEDGKCGENATWRIENGTLFIEGNGAMWDYSFYQQGPWFAYEDEIDHITIKDEITIVGDYAFCHLNNVGGIEIGKKVSIIGESAFSDLDYLDEVSIPSNVKKIGRNAFSECGDLEEVTFRDGLVEIDNGAFSFCKSLENANLPASLMNIGGDAFNGCSELESVQLPMFIEEVGTFCFANSGIEHISVPSTIKRISNGMFDGCNELEAVYYGGSEQDWQALRIDSNNEPLASANIYYNAR